tara:strand:+ start:2949 stop:3443 length:495 start_codon:yes stop_codon:yes gene_type:complete
MKLLSFTPDDELKEIIIDKTDNILNDLSSIDDRNIQLIEEWKLDNAVLECYGCLKNLNKEKINTHNLPPSDLSHTLYGDIYLVYRVNDSIIDMDISQYGMLCYYIEERYDNVEISQKFNEDISDEEIEEIDEIIDVSIKIKKTVKKNNIQEKLFDELEKDETKY